MPYFVGRVPKCWSKIIDCKHLEGKVNVTDIPALLQSIGLKHRFFCFWQKIYHINKDGEIEGTMITLRALGYNKGYYNTS